MNEASHPQQPQETPELTPMETYGKLLRESVEDNARKLANEAMDNTVLHREALAKEQAADYIDNFHAGMEVPESLKLNESEEKTLEDLHAKFGGNNLSEMARIAAASEEGSALRDEGNKKVKSLHKEIDQIEAMKLARGNEDTEDLDERITKLQDRISKLESGIFKSVEAETTRNKVAKTRVQRQIANNTIDTLDFYDYHSPAEVTKSETTKDESNIGIIKPTPVSAPEADQKAKEVPDVNGLGGKVKALKAAFEKFQDGEISQDEYRSLWETFRDEFEATADKRGWSDKLAKKKWDDVLNHVEGKEVTPPTSEEDEAKAKQERLAELDKQLSEGIASMKALRDSKQKGEVSDEDYKQAQKDLWGIFSNLADELGYDSEEKRLTWQMIGKSVAGKEKERATIANELKEYRMNRNKATAKVDAVTATPQAKPEMNGEKKNKLLNKRRVGIVAGVIALGVIVGALAAHDTDDGGSLKGSTTTEQTRSNGASQETSRSTAATDQTEAGMFKVKIGENGTVWARVKDRLANLGKSTDDSSVAALKNATLKANNKTEQTARLYQADDTINIPNPES